MQRQEKIRDVTTVFFSTGYIGIIYDLSKQGLLKWLSHKEKKTFVYLTQSTQGLLMPCRHKKQWHQQLLGWHSSPIIFWPRIAIACRHTQVKRSLCGRIQCFPPVTHTDISQNSAGCNYFSIHAPDTCFWWQSSDMKPERYGPCINRYQTIDRWAVLKKHWNVRGRLIIYRQVIKHDREMACVGASLLLQVDEKFGETSLQKILQRALWQSVLSGHY